ncbi:MAG: YebC/PmpR family DNA-binding transcriptional regulator [Proteobacteria bacterium]|nr:MAG: YebC/PmpR family DNA-binding transcriptional regulator [Pseudomonadota bacterium]
MSGHSKWSTIKRKKAATDAKRGKLFSKLLREIQVAAKLGGANPEASPRLRAAVQAAKAVSVPNDNIERAIKRGTGALEGEQFEEVFYEGYGPGGVAILVKALSNNRNRTAADVRHAFTRWGGNLGGSNAVSHIFKEMAVFVVPKSGIAEEKLIEIAVEAGAEDIREEENSWSIFAPLGAYSQVRDALEGVSKELSADFMQVPANTVGVSGTDAEQLLKLLNSLDELDDVQNVAANFEMDSSELERLEQEL